MSPVLQVLLLFVAPSAVPGGYLLLPCKRKHFVSSQFDVDILIIRHSETIILCWLSFPNSMLKSERSAFPYHVPRERLVIRLLYRLQLLLTHKILPAIHYIKANGFILSHDISNIILWSKLALIKDPISKPTISCPLASVTH